MILGGQIPYRRRASSGRPAAGIPRRPARAVLHLRHGRLPMTIPELALSAPVPRRPAPARRPRRRRPTPPLILMALPVLGVLAARTRSAARRSSPAWPACWPATCRSAQKMPIPLIRAAIRQTQTGTVLGLILGVAVSSVWALVVWLLVAPHPFGWLKEVRQGFFLEKKKQKTSAPLRVTCGRRHHTHLPVNEVFSFFLSTKRRSKALPIPQESPHYPAAAHGSSLAAAISRAGRISAARVPALRRAPGQIVGHHAGQGRLWRAWCSVAATSLPAAICSGGLCQGGDTARVRLCARAGVGTGCARTAPGRPARAPSAPATISTGSSRSVTMRRDNLHLLPVLLAEIGGGRAHLAEKFGHHGGHAGEMPGPRRTFPARRGAGDMDGRRRPGADTWWRRPAARRGRSRQLPAWQGRPPHRAGSGRNPLSGRIAAG